MPDAATMALLPETGTSPSPSIKFDRPSKIVPPRYPICAENMHLSGFVDLAFTLQPDGSVGDFHVTREMPAGFGFGAAATAVFGQWKFPPHLVDGKAVATQATYRFTWKLE